MSEEDVFTQYLHERNEALLSMDEQKIRAYLLKWNGNAGPSDPEIFWCSIHKARTALKVLPMEERSKSKRWLLEHGSESMDDGDVPI